MKSLLGNPPVFNLWLVARQVPLKGHHEQIRQRISPGTSSTDKTEMARHGIATVPEFCEGTQIDPATGWNPSQLSYKRWARP
jgi:hypothetical protein